MTNATQEPKTRSAGAVRVDRLRPNTWNKPRPRDEAFNDSIRSKGVLEPLIVREVDPDVEGRDLEILDGEGRWIGAMAVGLEYVPAVTIQASDEDAEMITLITTTHRANFSPWQVAELIGDMLGKGMELEAIAAATGWSVATIRRRRALLDVSPAWRAALDDGRLHTWTIQHFEVLAGFDEKFQEGLWKRIAPRALSMTVADLKEEIAEESKALKSAPWDLDDVALVPRAGACQGCEKRSDAQADLFGDASGESCLDGACFASKLKAFTRRKESELLEKHPEAVKISTSYDVGPKGALSLNDVKPAKKGDKGAVPAIEYGQGGKVSLTYVKVKKAAKEPTEKDEAKLAAKKRAARITALAIEKLIAIVEDKDTEFHKDAAAVLTQFCLVYGVGIEEPKEIERVRAFTKKPVTRDEMWSAVAERLVRELNQLKWGLERGWSPEDDSPMVELAAWLVEADFAELMEEAAADIDTAPAPSEEGAVPGTVDTDEWDNIEAGEGK